VTQVTSLIAKSLVACLRNHRIVPFGRHRFRAHPFASSKEIVREFHFLFEVVTKIAQAIKVAIGTKGEYTA
jgi:hypothetical protein